MRNAKFDNAIVSRARSFSDRHKRLPGFQPPLFVSARTAHAVIDLAVAFAGAFLEE